MVMRSVVWWRRLLGSRRVGELVRFAFVGAGGVLINNLVLFALHGLAHWPVIVASPLAVEAAIVNNFIWNDRWTFSARQKSTYRFLRFNLVSLGGLVVNTLTLGLLLATTSMQYLIANLFGIAAATGWNFVANARWTWKPSDQIPVEIPEFSRPGTYPERGTFMTNDIVIVPTYNEASNLRDLVESIVAKGPFSVLVVDDGSPDGTGMIADRLADEHQGRVAVIHRGEKAGLGSAYRAGFEQALESGAGRVYQMDADFSHDPAWLPLMRDSLRGGCDLVLGSRYTTGGSVSGWPWWRKALSRGGSTYAGLILGLGQRDLTGGFKGWRREAIEAIRPQDTRSDGYAFQIETTYRAKRAGARIAEIPIRFADRIRGASKMGWPIILEAIRVVPGLRIDTPEVGSVEHPVQLGSPLEGS